MKRPDIRNLKLLKFKRPTLFIIIAMELLLAVLFILLISQSVNINTDNSVIYADSDYIDEISYSDGLLIANNVHVQIPNEDYITYGISYAWGEDDDQYPTVPQTVNASFSDKEGETSKFDLVLYRESFTPTDDLEGKNALNWFNGWEPIDNEMSKQEPRKSGDINGFQISTIGCNSDSAYDTSSFYFPIQDNDGVSVYVLEGLLYDRSSVDDFTKVMDEAIASIQINNKS